MRMFSLLVAMRRYSYTVYGEEPAGSRARAGSPVAGRGMRGKGKQGKARRPSGSIARIKHQLQYFWLGSLELSRQCSGYPHMCR